jgi:hypothetical protein
MDQLNKKLVTMITLLSFLWLNFNCAIYTSETKKIAPTVTQLKRQQESVLIIGVVTKQGKLYEFPKDKPAVRGNGMVCGITVTDENVSIPLDDIDQVVVRKVNVAGTIVVSVLGATFVAAAIFAVIGVIVAALKESCPFIYSYDGHEYTFDAEPYGGAICEGLTRTEWCRLEHVKEVDGTYRIKITNEVDETQYTDELKLVAVDHPTDVLIVPEANGILHTFRTLQPAARSYDQKGRDLQLYVAKDDWIFWHSSIDAQDAADKQNLRDTLVFEFAKPRDARNVKLLVNGCTTLWGSQMLKRYLELGGKYIGRWYKKMNDPATSRHNGELWTQQAQLYELKALVETAQGWKEKAVVQGGGPFISEDKAYLFDVSDVPGDTLRLKLCPPKGFWQFNYMAVDYAPDDQVRVTEIEAASAADHQGRDVRELFSKKDKQYQVMPEIGDFAEVVFPAPARAAGSERTILAKVTGYYDIHLNQKKKAQLALFKKIQRDPDLGIVYALQEYHKWEKNIKELNLESGTQK